MRSNFVVRTVTGLVFVLVLIGCILWNWATFALLFATITGLTIWEFTTIVNKNLDLQVNRLITTVAGVYLFAAVFAFNREIAGAEVFIPYVLSIIYLPISELYLNHEKSLLNWAFALMAQLYIALPFSTICILSFFKTVEDYTYIVYYTPIFTLSVFIFIWLSDSGAYIVGSRIGKRKLFPSISPKKSWEGPIGGAIFAVIASQLIAINANNFSDTPVLNHLGWAGLALVVVAFGTWGDLVESMLKRRLGIKDSGHILPGHGGFLDRFDSSLMAFPAAMVYIYTLRCFVG